MSRRHFAVIVRHRRLGRLPRLRAAHPVREFLHDRPAARQAGRAIAAGLREEGHSFPARQVIERDADRHRADASDRMVKPGATAAWVRSDSLERGRHAERDRTAAADPPAVATTELDRHPPRRGPTRIVYLLVLAFLGVML